MKKQNLLLTLALLMPISLPLNAAIQSAEEKGLEIAQEMDKRDTGWKDQSSTLVMTLRNKYGDETTRNNRMKSLEVKGDGDKSVIVFDTPVDIKGTTFLSHTHAIKNDDQWIYLPSLKRVKRVSSSNKSGPFMGSEFAYEDISSQEVEKYTYKYLNDEVLDGRETFVIERVPAYKKSGYKRQIVWVDKEYYQPIRVEYFDRKNVHLKTLTFHNYQKYLGKFWRTSLMEMKNHQTGKSTSLSWNNYEFQTGLKPRDFKKNMLKRIR